MKTQAITPLGLRSQVVCVFALLLTCGWHVPTGQAQHRRALTEEFRVHRDFHSKFLTNGREIVVWLPPGYDSEPARRYPVLYMQDGGDVFVSLRIDEVAKPLFASQQIEPLIIVMVSIGGTMDDRMDEYTPTRNSSGKGGKADLYGRMLVEELKPFIDSEYRTRTDAPNTGLGGFSLGGLVSLYLGLKYPTVFGKLAVMSPSVWWDNKLIVRNVKALTSKPAMRIWLDIGTDEGSRELSDAKDLRDALVKKGWILNSDLMYFEAKGGRHDLASFAKRSEPMLKYLFAQ
jgi:predicted alpha/beta superfamily hydrolase